MNKKPVFRIKTELQKCFKIHLPFIHRSTTVQLPPLIYFDQGLNKLHKAHVGVAFILVTNNSGINLFIPNKTFDFGQILHEISY